MTGPGSLEVGDSLAEQLSALHNESLMLACQHLDSGHDVRLQAEAVVQDWKDRAEKMTRAITAPPPSRLSRLSRSSQRPRSMHSSIYSSTSSCSQAFLRRRSPRSSEGVGLPKEERLYRGIPPLVDLEQHRRRALMKPLRPLRSRALSAELASICSGAEMSIVDETDDIGMQDILPDLNAEELAAKYGDTGRSQSPGFSEPGNPAADCFSPKSAGADSVASSCHWGHHSVKLGDLYTKSSPRLKDLTSGATGQPVETSQSSNWQSVRRLPISTSMQGPGGKANWALRQDGKKSVVVRSNKRLNAFEDWTKNVSGPKMGLVQQVLSTDKGMELFSDGLKYKSSQFKNFWLEEMGADELFEDRTFYCKEGWHQMNRRRNKFEPELSHKGEELFNHYQIPCSRSSPSLPSYKKLLEASQGVMAKHMPQKRDIRETKKEKKHDAMGDVAASLRSMLSF
eukprot:TRINITY_DN38228_c0_g1_i1.p1 TRINITY_DN38228_c0_g1~~TRINITY_DN38228_c0_g1_i1.p1  ORF type:complete len:470 (-),score=85.34 TRINITY_DN38228_c0_g1_i1:67-1428(-)